MKRAEQETGFTLIELSITLVIIGLLVGGVLVGQELIRSAAIRATITQVEKFNTAKNTFIGKYGELPGDMSFGTADTYGFATVDFAGSSRGSVGGSGDSNGVIEGNLNGDTSAPSNLLQGLGETGWFWSDMSYANGMNLNLIEGSYGSVGGVGILQFQGTVFGLQAMKNLGTTGIGHCLPPAKIGRSSYFYVYSSGGFNYYGLATLSSTNNNPPIAGALNSSPSLSAAEAFSIDSKVDDGLPRAGSVQTNYVGTSGGFGVGNIAILASQSAALGSYTSATCSDSATGMYATGSPANGNGATVACNLSFRFQ